MDYDILSVSETAETSEDVQKSFFSRRGITSFNLNFLMEMKLTFLTSISLFPSHSISGRQVKLSSKFHSSGTADRL